MQSSSPSTGQLALSENSSGSEPSRASTRTTSPDSVTLAFASCLPIHIADCEKWPSLDESSAGQGSTPIIASAPSLPLRYYQQKDYRHQPRSPSSYASMPLCLDASQWQHAAVENPHWVPSLASRHSMPGVTAPLSPAPAVARSELDQASPYAYVLDRGNGEYTRLVPADMLPPLRDVPRRQPLSAGLTALQPLTGAAPHAAVDNNTEVGLKVSTETTGRSTCRLRPEPNAETAREFPVEVKDQDSDIQKRIDSIVSSTTAMAAKTAPVPAPAPATSAATNRKTKIYCDKWIHDGVCAFTQQGCKFRHEMPLDKPTQQQLGLFHGLPGWWKKHQADLYRNQQRDLYVLASLPATQPVIADGLAAASCAPSLCPSPPRHRPAAGGAGSRPRHASLGASSQRLGPSTCPSYWQPEAGGLAAGPTTARPSLEPLRVSTGSMSRPGPPLAVNVLAAAPHPRPPSTTTSATTSAGLRRGMYPMPSPSTCVWGPIAPPPKQPEPRDSTASNWLL